MAPGFKPSRLLPSLLMPPDRPMARFLSVWLSLSSLRPQSLLMAFLLPSCRSAKNNLNSRSCAPWVPTISADDARQTFDAPPAWPRARARENVG
jgi:hypothetical protein